MSCKHLMWGHYCKKRQEFCQDAFEDHEELCVNCSDYKDENEVIDLKKIFNKGPVTNTNCDCKKSTAANDYVSMLEMFINKCYPTENFGLFNMSPEQAETHVDNNMRYLGYDKMMIDRAYYDTIIHFADSKYNSCYIKFNNFTKGLLQQPHKDYPKKECSSEFRFVLTLILGYLNKLDSVAIINCDNPEKYFEGKVSDVSVFDLTEAIDKARRYAKESNDFTLAEGMRKFDAWLKRLGCKNIPPKELTIADIEKQLGYKIKIVGDVE